MALPAKAVASAVVVRVTNNFSYLKTPNQELLDSISKKFTFGEEKKKGNIFYGPAVTAFVHKKGRFGTGLIVFLFIFIFYFYSYFYNFKLILNYYLFLIYSSNKFNVQ
jgi:hypothetical protein